MVLKIEKALNNYKYNLDDHKIVKHCNYNLTVLIYLRKLNRSYLRLHEVLIGNQV